MRTATIHSSVLLEKSSMRWEEPGSSERMTDTGVEDSFSRIFA